MKKWNFKKLTKGESITGIYLSQYRSVGAFKKPVHEILPSGTGEAVHIWGSATLNTILYGTTFGSLIKITYNGKGTTPEMKYTVHLYDVEVIEPAEPRKKAERKPKTKKVVNNKK